MIGLNTKSIGFSRSSTPRDTRTVNVLVIYAEHQASLEDPLNPGEYNDHANVTYQSHYKWLSTTIEEWVSANYNNPLDPTLKIPPLPAMAKMMFGDYHKFNVIHVGLDESRDTITPYVVPTTQCANGYYVHQTPREGEEGELPINTAGWTEYNSIYPDGGYQRQAALLKQIIRSGYLEQHLDANLKYDNNICGKFDFIIFAVPQLYKRDYYDNDWGGSATIDTLNPSYTLFGRTFDQLFWQPQGWDSTRILMHEYMHSAFYDLINIAIPTPELFADKDWIGEPDPITLPRYIPDIYIASTNPSADSPWNRQPCNECSHVGFIPQSGWATTGKPGTLLPMMAASMGFTNLNRWAKSSGTYTIKNCLNTMDFLCLQSPYDQTQFLILSVFTPIQIGGGTSYPYNGDLFKGVYATVLKPKSWGYAGRTYGNFSNPCACYMVDTCTYKWQYGDIGMQDYRWAYNDPEHLVDSPNKKLVLLDHDHPETNPSGLLITNNPFGVTVSFANWTFQDGVIAAQVNITIAT